MVNTKASDLPTATTATDDDAFVLVDDPLVTPSLKTITTLLMWNNNLKAKADALYIGKAVAGEISIITAKASVVDGDFLLLEDSAAANAKKRTTFLDVWDNLYVAKSNALYFALGTAGQISALTDKAAPVGPDTIFINDSAAANAVKKTTITNLLTGSGVAGEMSTKFSTDTKTTPAATNDYFMMADPDNGTPALKEHGVKIEDMWANALSAKAAADNPVKVPCIVATTANITLSGEQTIDGVLTSTNRVLVKDQTAGAENGIYVTAAGAWARSADFDVAAEVVDGTMVRVEQGTAKANTLWALTTNNPITVDTTALAFAEIAAGSGISNVVEDVTPQIGGTVGLDMQGQDIVSGGVVFMTEQAAAEGDVGGQGQLWVKTVTPNELWFTDDAGTDFQLATLTGTETFTNKSISADQITALAPNRQTGTTYTLVIGDAQKIIEMNNASANTLTIPLNSSVAFAVGDIINVIQYGAGVTTVDGATSVTVNGVSSGGAAIDARYNGVSIHKTATDEWVMVGAHGTVA